MPSQDPWQQEQAVRAALREHWGADGELRRMQAGPASLTWQAGGHVVKLARDEPDHFTAGLRASEAVERAGIPTGAPVMTRAGQWCVPLTRCDGQSRVLAVLRRVGDDHLPMRSLAPAALGEFLGRLHRILRGCPAAGAWTPGDVLGHMMRGTTAAQPPAIRQMIGRAVSDVRAYYAAAPAQLLYGDGPELFSVNGTDISAIVDWGGVRAGSTADDIGCWTAHGATDCIPLPAYTAAFLDGYRHTNDLPATEAAAVPLFQRLRIASRACYVTDPGALASVEAWMRQALSG